MGFSFNEEQQYILQNMDIPMQVAAGAGSGKTRVLVERYCRLLCSGIRVSSILAVTFTRKAAGEMTERIRKRIAEDGTFNRRAREYLQEELAFAFIGTIHSICARLLRENPVEAGVDPYFQLVDEVEAYNLKMEIIRRTVYEYLDGDNPYLLEYIRLYGLKNLFSDLYDFLQAISSRGIDLGHLMLKTELAYTERKNQLPDLVDELEKNIAELAAALPELNAGKNRENIEKLVDDFPLYRPVLSRLREEPGYDPDAYAVLQKLGEYELKSLGKAGGLIKKFRHSLNSMKSCLWEVKHFPLLNQAFLPLAQEIQKRIGEEKERLNQLDFDDLEAKTLAMFRNHPRLLDKYQKQFEYIMIDEFQDINYRQFEIFRLLSRDFQGNIFAVGDPKQSIYRFRGARVELFGKAGKIIEEKGEIVGLNRNYRTLSPIIEFINYFFARLMQDEDIDFIPLHPERKMPAQIRTFCYVVGGYNENRMQKAEVQAYLAADIIQDITGSEGYLVWDEEKKRERYINYGDIALLFRTTANMHLFARLFKEYGIPFYVLGSRDFFLAEEVVAVLNLLKALADRDDEVSLAGALRSFLFRVENETLWLMKKEGGSLRSALKKIDMIPAGEEEKQKLKKAAEVLAWGEALQGRLAPSELIRALWDKTGGLFLPLKYSDAQQKEANINKLANMAFRLEEKGMVSLPHFLAYVEEARKQEVREKQASIDREGQDRVKLMTVHQSKGLEFPVVMVPELERGFNEEDSRQNILVRDEEGVFLKLDSRETSGEERETSCRRQAEEKEKKDLASEYKRLFYVAMTRARDFLILTGLGGISINGELAVPGEDKEPRSWLDFLLMAVGDPETGTIWHPCLEARIFSLYDIPPQKHVLPSRVLPPELPKGENMPAAEGERLALAFRSISPTYLAEYSYCPLGAYMNYAERVNPEHLREEKEGFSSTSLGRLVHHLAEKADSRKKAENMLKNYKGVTEEEKIKALELFDTYLSHQGMQDISRKSSYHKEVPFLLKLDDNFYLKGIIDGLGIAGDEIYIVDLKTGQKRDEYAKQLAAYRRAAEKIMPGKKADTFIFYLKGGELLKTEAELDLSIKREMEFWQLKTPKCAACIFKNLCFPEKEEEGRDSYSL